jgi:hypothetical protein
MLMCQEVKRPINLTFSYMVQETPASTVGKQNLQVCPSCYFREFFNHMSNYAFLIMEITVISNELFIHHWHQYDQIPKIEIPYDMTGDSRH